MAGYLVAGPHFTQLGSDDLAFLLLEGTAPHKGAAHGLARGIERGARRRAALRKLSAQLRYGYVTRHRERGKMTARERIALLLDRDSPFLELCPFAAWGTQYAVGASSMRRPP